MQFEALIIYSRDYLLRYLLHGCICLQLWGFARNKGRAIIHLETRSIISDSLMASVIKSDSFSIIDCFYLLLFMIRIKEFTYLVSDNIYSINY